MPHRIHRITGFALAAILLATSLIPGYLPGTRTVHAQDGTPRFDPIPCPFVVPLDEIEGETLACGQLMVPENRANPDSPTIALMVAILRNESGHVDREPVIYLEGGPGGSALASVDLWYSDSLRQDHDLILIDQRGVGFSTPSLNCPEVDDLNTYPSDDDWLEACRQRLVNEGINLAAYNTVESAADIADLAAVLNLDAVNMLGISYGTRLALEVMQNHPEIVRSAVLDSVYPPEVSMFIDDAVIIPLAFERLFEACDADVVCRTSYPQLRAHFDATVTRLKAKPVWLDHNNVELDAGEFMLSLIDMLAFTYLVPQVPAAIEAAYARDYVLMTDLIAGYYATGPHADLQAVTLDDESYFAWLYAYLGRYETMDEMYAYLDTLSDEDYYTLLEEFEYAYDLMQALHVPDFDALFDTLDALSQEEADTLTDAFQRTRYDDSEGLYTSVHCTDEIPFYTPIEIAAMIASADPVVVDIVTDSVQRLRADCAIWDVPSADASENEPITSDIPALLLSGALDPITPPEWGDSAAAHLSQSTHVIVPGASHGVFDAGPCVTAIIGAFFASPTASPYTACLDDKPLTFEVLTPEPDY